MIVLNSTDVSTSWLGSTAYAEALLIQKNISDEVRNSSNAGVVLGLEHPPVITLGKRGSSEDLLLDCEMEVIEVDRGGQATLHSPGQLVVYPILKLRDLNLSVRGYVEQLEKSTIRMLSRYGIQASQGSQAGVFTERGKIAFVGVRIDRGVTRHGISINVSNDLGYFSKIRPCGFVNGRFDRMIDHVDPLGSGVLHSLEDVFRSWSQEFSQGLSYSDQ
jgi:lipoate-protein ligase B